MEKNKTKHLCEAQSLGPQSHGHDFREIKIGNDNAVVHIYCSKCGELKTLRADDAKPQ
jgi:hypothetical protein